jgi:hypothetical protein
MSKREAELKAALMRELKRQCPEFFVFFLATAGAADRGIAGNGRATFWEFKHATPHFDSPGNQVLACCRLDRQCYCRYVIWWEDAQGENRQTLIATPKAIHARTNAGFVHEASNPSFDPKWVVNYIKRAHGV